MGFAAEKGVTAQHFPEVRWHGHWIWVPEEPIQMGNPISPNIGERPAAHGMFRRSFDLRAIPAVVPARITADARYVLTVNGREVGRGPIRSQPRRLYYDMYNLAPFLRRGRNVIAVLVKHYGKATSFWMPPVGNATLGRSGVMVFEADLGAEWLVSDATWKARKASAWLDDANEPGAHIVAAGVPAESFDASAMAFDWSAEDGDDSAWGFAQIITPIHIGGRGRSQPPTDPYGPLYPRPIAALTGDRVGPVSLTAEAIDLPIDVSARSPAARVEASALRHLATRPPVRSGTLPLRVMVPQGGYVRLILDMGRIVAGVVEFSFEAPAGTIFDISYAEELVTHPAPFGAHGGNRYIARGKDDRHSPFDKQGFRYVYVLIHNVAGPVSLTGFVLREDLYPWQGGSTFACSDDDLNRIFRAGVRTIALNSWDAFIDCPTREQRSWVGDAVVHQMVHLATNTDWRLAWHYLSVSNSPRPDGILPMSVAGDVEAGAGFTIPDWSLHWVHGVHNLYRFAGDRERVKEYLPTVERILRWYLPYLTEGGVLQDVVEWNLVDWSSLYSEDKSAIVTASWARGLREYAEMAAWLGETASRDWAEALHGRVKAGFEIFWDEGRGTYVDRVKDGVAQRPVNQLAGALAIVSELAPADRWGRIIDAITDARRLVVRSWMFPGANAPASEAGLRFSRMISGGLVPDWDVENEIVMAEPFMSYVVHDAVAAAGRADLLPSLCKRWLEFLVDGYDTLGENWGTGTHSHGWSCTPVKDLVFYTLGVTPAAPGYALARIAPRLGELEWAKGSVPTPHGLIHVEKTGGQVKIDSPVPVIVELPGRAAVRLDAGRHEL